MKSKIRHNGARKILAQRNLLDFTKFTMPNYEVNWHHKLLCDYLDKFARGEIRRLMIFMPPQHGKSELVSRRLPAFLLGKNPDARLAVTSYAHSLASKFNRQVQRIIDSQEYHTIFPETKISNSRFLKHNKGNYVRNASEFEIVNHKGSLISVGIGGGLTGNPVDYAIIDDPLKDKEEAFSETIRERVWEWYGTVLKSRLHNDSQVLITLTRWHSEDLAGKILDLGIEDYVVLTLPAIKVVENDKDPRKAGEALWPERHNLEKLLIEKKSDPHMFDSMYQQEPVEKKNRLYPSLNFYTKLNRNEPEGRVAFIDTADEGDDYLCLTHGLLFGEKIYINKVFMSQEGMEETLLECAKLLNEQKTQYCRVESNFGGKIFGIELSKLTPNCEILPAHESRNKHTRIIMNEPFVRKNCIFEKGLDEIYLSQIMKYSRLSNANSGKHDDAIDSMTGLCNFVKGIFPDRYS